MFLRTPNNWPSDVGYSMYHPCLVGPTHLILFHFWHLDLNTLFQVRIVLLKKRFNKALNSQLNLIDSLSNISVKSNINLLYKLDFSDRNGLYWNTNNLLQKLLDIAECLSDNMGPEPRVLMSWWTVRCVIKY